MSTLGNQIGVAGAIRHYGIPAGTNVSWTGLSGTARAGTVFEDFSFAAERDTTDGHGIGGEYQTTRGVRDRLTASFRVVPVGGASSTWDTADARIIAADIPMKNTLMTIANAANAWAAIPGVKTDKFLPKAIGASSGNFRIDSSSVAYSPDNAAVISLSVTGFLADDGVTLLTLVVATVT